MLTAEGGKVKEEISEKVVIDIGVNKWYDHAYVIIDISAKYQYDRIIVHDIISA